MNGSMMLRSPKCLVTRGAGFIGSNLVESLALSGATVHVLDDFSTGRRENLASLAAKSAWKGSCQ